MKTGKMIAAGAALALFGSAAHAGTVLGFYNITNNDPGDAALGEAQLSVEIQAFTLNMTDGVLFTFRNQGMAQMTIAEVYFDDGTLLALSDLIDSDQNSGDPNVDFEAGSAAPPDLPGGNDISPPFNVTAGFLADSDNPAPVNGVNPGEELGVFFTLQGGQDVNDVLDAIALAGEDGGLRIGIHVINFESGGSESFINIIPPPSAAGMGLAGLGLVAVRRRR